MLSEFAANGVPNWIWGMVVQEVWWQTILPGEVFFFFPFAFPSLRPPWGFLAGNISLESLSNLGRCREKISSFCFPSLQLCCGSEPGSLWITTAASGTW